MTKTFLQIELGEPGHTHHWRKHCIKCGTVETCRCSEPKVDVDGICFDCCEKLGVDYETGRSVAKVASAMSHYFVNADTGKTIRVNSHYDFVFNTTRSDQRSFLELGLTKKEFEFFLSREYRAGDIAGFLKDFNVIRVSCSVYTTLFEAYKASLRDVKERFFDFCMENFSSLSGGGAGMGIEIWHNGRRVLETKWGEFMQGDGMRFASGATYWHGSNIPDITSLRANSESFSLLGAGVYMYKNRDSAIRYGNILYKVSVPRSLKIAPKNFEFKDTEIEMIFKSLGVEIGEEANGYRNQPSGIRKVAWWGTDGWSYYGKDRKKTVEVISEMMKYLGWDGMTIDYPNGGEVCVVWKNYDRLVVSNGARTASGTQTLWHISNEKFSRFDTYKTAQGIIWFARDVESLQKDLHGASINNRKPVYLYKCDVRTNKTAGWDDYEKYGIGQLRDMGYDSAELSGDVAVFSARSVRILEVREVGGMKASTSVGECKVYMPPEKFYLGDGKMSVFLAGSIDMGKADDWQTELTEYLKDVDCVVLNPRRKDWDSSWKQEMENDKFREQVEWELKGLEECGLIALCLTKDSKAPISLLEMGLHISDGKMIVFCPEGYWRKGNVDIVCERHGVPVLADWMDFKKEVHRRMKASAVPVPKVANDRTSWRIMAKRFISGMYEFEADSDPVVAALQGMGIKGLSTVAGEQDIRWQAVFMIGSPGAGKSYIVGRNYLTHANFKLIDPDEVKRRHPDYDPSNPASLHEWSKEVSDAEFASVVKSGNGDPVVVDGTGTNAERLINKINMAKISGYRTFLVYVWVPFEVAILRNRNRERFVPESVIMRKYDELDSAFGKMRNIVDKFKVVSNYEESYLREAIEDIKRYPVPQAVRPPRDGRMVASDNSGGMRMSSVFNRLSVGDIRHVNMDEAKSFGGLGFNELQILRKVVKEGGGKVVVKEVRQPPHGMLEGSAYVVAHGNPVSAMLGGVYVPWHILTDIGYKAMMSSSMLNVGDICKVDISELKACRIFLPQQMKIVRDIIRQGGGKVEIESIGQPPHGMSEGNAYIVAYDNPMSKIMGGVYVPWSCLTVVGKKAGMGDTVPFGSPLRSRRDYGTGGKDVESQGLKLPSEDIMTGKTAKKEMTGRQHRVARLTYRIVSKA